ncbi:group III truncated hemoglobin [Deinococcus sp. YIM 77859]|uniref:group III truncated hemoglobin n=1 Tax=Deinococcus sp. YIM 77859 TaxID=1540221 RepID=UPI00069106D7|nr:group III truncated hemoglobin [Deinococcus sp. YIM 77859]
MLPGPLLSTVLLPTLNAEFAAEVVAATPEALPSAAALLVPHDGQPVADVRDRPDRWARLNLLAGAVRRGLPVLAWGSGAALAGRVLGAGVQLGGAAGEWARAPRGAQVLAWRGELPLLWRAGRVTAWADPTLSGEVRAAFLAGLAETTARAPASALEAVGGEAALRAVLADFYARARADPLLGPMFAAHVTDWAAHLDGVTAFWVTMLGGGAAWRGNLNRIHAGLGLRGKHLTRWLDLWREAAQAHLSPDAAALLVGRAETMGQRLAQAKRGNAPHLGRVP